jgi:hypothetical protein
VLKPAFLSQEGADYNYLDEEVSETLLPGYSSNIIPQTWVPAAGRRLVRAAYGAQRR